MKNNLCKIFRYFFVLSLIISISFSAKASKDTTILLADNHISNTLNTTSATPVVNINNVVYPKSLQPHRAQTLEYVENFSKKRRDYLIRIYKNGKKFFPKVVTVLKKFQLPQELKVLIALESGFNPNAISRVGALGYWQIMDEVAREYGLHIVNNKEASAAKLKNKDDRKNFSKSTLAAAKYLKDRCRNLNNNLLLIVASYNCGVGKVWEAMRKSGKSSPDFWDVKKYLPAETRNYVLNFITLNVIFDNYDKFIKNQLVFAPEPSVELTPLQISAIMQSVQTTTD